MYSDTEDYPTENNNSKDAAKLFSQTGNEKTIKNLVSKLRFIAKVNPGEKLNVKELFVRDNNVVWQRFLRTMRDKVLWEDGESKESTQAFVEAVTDEAINLICYYRSDKTNDFNNQIADLLTRNLEEAIKGMESLIETYKDDRIYSSKIEAMMGTLTLRLETLKNG